MVRVRVFPRRLLALLLIPAVALPGALTTSPAHALPPPPVLLSPSYGALTTAASYPPTGTPTFEWQPVSGADRYTIQVCPSAGCASPLLWQDTSSTRFTPPVALPDGTLYWRVRARDSSGWGDYSDAWPFNKSWLNYGSMTTILLEPPPDATVEFFEYPIFSWTPVEGAAYYRFRIFNQPGCPGSPIYTKETIKPTHSPTSRRTRGDYYWQVSPVDNREHEGTPSECRHFFMDYQQKPTLLAPADFSHEMFTPEFRWTAVKGAKDYHLQVSTVDDFSSLVLDVWTPNTRYTPLVTLENDKEYYWRVAARDTSETAGPWNPALPELRRFYMEWHLVPNLLSPTDNYINVPFPVFQWTPVAGARRYRIQVDLEQSFAPPLKFEQTVMDPRYDHLDWGTILIDTDYYWRVRAEDNRGYDAPWSDTESFRYSWTPAPTLIYPPYYYDPALEPSTRPLDVRTDPTVPVPVFMWDRVVHNSPSEQVSADYYTIQVDDDQNFTLPEWTTTTKNLSVAPTLASPFNPAPGTTYYWRVRAYAAGGALMGTWSEAWPARFDPSLQASATTIALHFPTDGWDSVYDTPLFGWSAVQGAARYHFQISTAPDGFGAPVYEAFPLYNFYTPRQRLVPETYYWRVRAQGSGGSYIGDWSEVRRFVVTHQLRRGSPSALVLPHPILDEASFTRVGQDPAGDASGGTPYDLTGLYLAQDPDTWYLTIDLPVTNTTQVYFVFYVDLDHQEGSGGTYDRLGFNVQASSIYRPEVVVYARHNTLGQIDQVFLNRWEGSAWGPDQDLVGIGGAVAYQRGKWLELEIPRTALEFLGENWLGTVSLEAFSAPSGGQAYDTVPSEGSAPTSSLTNFTAAADKVNPLHPWNNPFTDPFILQTNPPLSFAKPVGRSYVCGYKIQVARDYLFTTILKEEFWKSATAPQYWFLGTRWTWTETFEENATLYWRVRLAHDNPADPSFGPWSQPMRFTKVDYVPESVSADYSYTNPTLRWDRVEGAASYHVDVDDDPGFSSLNINIDTDLTSFTPYISLADRTWHWRLRVRDGSNRSSSYKPGGSFTKTSEAPVPTSPIGGVVLNELPTLQWTNVLYPALNPIVSSPRYRMVLDNDPNFSYPYVWGPIDLDTISLTTERGNRIEDGTYYWRVALLDSYGNVGPYSPAAQFYKAYLIPPLISARFDASPDLTWGSLDGAAYYEVQICRDSVYADCVETARTDQTNYVSPIKYNAGMYFWRVRMCDKAGACGPYYQDRLASGQLIFLPLVPKRE